MKCEGAEQSRASRPRPEFYWTIFLWRVFALGILFWICVVASVTASPRPGLAMVVASGEDATDETLVVVTLPPEAKLVPGTQLEFTDLGTKRPHVRLPNGVRLIGRYEESVGSLLVLGVTDNGATLTGKSETRLIFAPSRGAGAKTDKTRKPRSGR